MNGERFRFEAELWIWRPNKTESKTTESLKGSWYFLSLPADVAEWISFFAPQGGWGSVPVNVQIGATRWQTSIFKHNKSGTYILPVKAVVRQAEGLALGMSYRVTLEMR